MFQKGGWFAEAARCLDCREVDDRRVTIDARNGAGPVLIVFPGALGDLIFLIPTISAISRRHAPAEIELMTRDELARFAVGRLGITRGHSIDRREMAHLFRESASDSEEARRFFGSFDRIYCFFNANDPHFRIALTEASRPGASSFHLFRPPAQGHVAAAYLSDVTGDSNLEDFAIAPLTEDLESANRALSGIGVRKKFVAIFPGSGSPTKNWPIEKFVALADRISKTTRAIFVLGPAEVSLQRFLADQGHAVITQQSLGTVAAISKMASAFVGNDSGMSHLAAAVGTPGVVLFGSTDPDRWRPLGPVQILRRDPIETIEVTEVLASLYAARS
jgi:ADP-heptose:LPS heptosyltransferase